MIAPSSTSSSKQPGPTAKSCQRGGARALLGKLPRGALWAIVLAPLLHLIGLCYFQEPVASSGLRRKVDALTAQARPVLAFAGDSRVRSGVVPSVVADSLGLPSEKVVNIAEVSCDSAAMWSAYREFSPRFAEHPVVLLGVSALTVNDGYLLVGDELLWDLSFHERCRLVPAARAITACFLPEKAMWNAWTAFYWPQDPSIAHGGYSLEYGDRDLTRHKNKDWRKAATLIEAQWYHQPQLDGLRWAKLQKHVQAFVESGAQLVLVDSPYHPGFKRYTRAGIQQIDQDFHRRLAELASRAGVPLMSFPDNWCGSANPDALFYDLVHLNRAGARLYSKLIAAHVKELARDGLVRLNTPGAVLAARRD